MSEIPKEALEKAAELANVESRVGVLYSADNVMGVWPLQALARFIADVSEKAKCIKRIAAGTEGFDAIRPIADTLILPNPEDDLLKEAREICATEAEENKMPGTAEMFRMGELDTNAAMRCTLTALKKGKK